MKKTLSPDAYVSKIETLFRQHSNAARAAGAAAYMRNQFIYYGITTPERRAIQKQFHEEYALPPVELMESIVHTLWNKKQRELHYFAMEFALRYKKQFTEKHLPLFEFMITNNSWWDSVDVVAPKLVAPLLLSRPEFAAKTAKKWIKSGNVWLMRSALLYQLHYKQATNEPLLFELILSSCKHPDFFIRKAIGWILRHYARTNPAGVKKFLSVHAKELSPLSLREAMKHL